MDVERLQQSLFALEGKNPTLSFAARNNPECRECRRPTGVFQVRCDSDDSNFCEGECFDKNHLQYHGLEPECEHDLF